MIKIKLLDFKKILFLIILAGSCWSFCYFEEIVILKILVIFIAVVAAWPIIISSSNNPYRKVELAASVAFFLSLLAFYNLLYSLNLPIFLIMLLIFVLVSYLFYFTFSANPNPLFDQATLWLFTVLAGLTLLEIFLGLYFWPVTPEFRSLIMVVCFYSIINLIHLYANNVLRLRKAIGFILVGILIVGIILFTTWLKMPR